jgi:myo-inositol catabolism protein IolC
LFTSTAHRDDNEVTVPDSELFILAMDHRDSLAKDLYGITGEPSKADADRIAAGKKLVFAGLVAALDRDDADRGEAGVLVDERYGSDVATQTPARGITLAMPIERSGQDLFTLEYGPTWFEHVEDFDPAHVKVLVRDNPQFDAGDRRTQFERLAEVSAVLHSADRSFLFELLVPATDDQLASVDGDKLRYDTEVRPALTVQVIADMQSAGVEPHIWKIEGLETPDAASAVVAAARAGGRESVRCIVLGRDAPAERLDHWLDVAAATDGFCGFAIGRSIWEKPLAEHIAGHLIDEQLIAQVADAYLHFAAAYRQAQV